MSNTPSARRASLERTDSLTAAPGSDASQANTTTVVRADVVGSPAPQGTLHPLLQAQLRELRLRTGSSTPDLPMLLQIVSAHYDAIDDERRGIVQSMRLMADEARALAHEARE